MLTLTFSFAVLVLGVAIMIALGLAVVLTILTVAVGTVFLAPLVIDILMLVGLIKLLFCRKKKKQIEG